LYVITFYSFKGGVGRTMALVNVAAELVRRGRKVLVVDFDLEAPGLETYKHLRPAKPYPGIVEYVTEFRRSYAVPNVFDYIYEAKAIGKKGGRLWVMSAGRRDRAYRNALASLDWQRLYKNEDGFLLFEDTKKGWEEALQPDYVLIDSRTGDTDVLGICTRQLPHSVVLMFTPNEQNLVGLKNVCEDIRREETEGLKKKIRLHFVATNVPDLDDENRILRQQINAFRERLAFTELSSVIRRYENLTLLNQNVFVLDRPHSKLARSYRRLVRTLLKDNLGDRDGALFFLQDYRERHKTRIEGTDRVNRLSPAAQMSSDRTVYVHSIQMVRDGTVYVHDNEGRWVMSVSQLEDKNSLREIARHFDSDAEILNKVAECFIVEEDFRNAVQMFDWALRSKPNHAGALLHRAICKLNLALVDEAADDLIACLRLPVSDAPFSAINNPVDNRAIFMRQFHSRALAKLHDIAPRRILDVADMLETQSLQGVEAELVADFLCDTEEGIPRAARLLRASLAGDETKRFGSVAVRALLRARCWKEILDLKGAERLEQKGAGSILELALACWGEDGEVPKSLCKQALEAILSDEQFLINWGFQAVALLSWGAGNVADAIEHLKQAEHRARAQTDDSFSSENADKVFSVWRLSNVSIEQFMEDCQMLRRMFQGEPLRPTFLGPPLSSKPK
jgi:MinD-like ATPase involved in chromosome partitioning or flagellar assembly